MFTLSLSGWEGRDSHAPRFERTRTENFRPVSRVRACTRSLTADALVDEILEALADIERCTQRIIGLESALRPFVERLVPGLLTIRGVASVVAAGLLGHAGSLRNCRDANAFAMRAGVAPLTFASGSSSTVRVNYLGDRQLNRCLHVIGMVQIRGTDHPGNSGDRTCECLRRALACPPHNSNDRREPTAATRGACWGVTSGAHST